MRTVLIFAYECAPYNRIGEATIGAQRPAQFAKYLPQFGWRAVVLCCDARGRGAGCSADLRDRTRRIVGDADRSSSVIVPTPSLPWDGVVDRLWRKALPEHGRANRFKDIVRKPLTAAKLFKGDYSQAWQPCAQMAAEAVAATVPVHAVIGEHSPDAGLFLAQWYSRKYKVPWVADFRDPIMQPLIPIMRRIYKPFARSLVGTAESTINVTPFWAELDSKLFGRPSRSIPNGFDPEEFSRSLTMAPSQKFTIALTGSMSPPRRLDIFLEGLRLLRGLIGSDSFTEVQFRYRGTKSHHVASMAAHAGVSEVTESAGQVPRHESIEIMRTSQCLLLLSIATDLESDLYWSRGLYPGKTFEYFGASRPILCVPSDGGQLDDLISRTRTGVSVRTPADVARQLTEWFHAWKRSGAIPYEPCEQVVGRYTRHAVAGELASVLEAAIGTFGSR